MTTPTARRKHPGRAGHPPELREEAAALRREGVGRAAIARHLGVGFATICRWFREDGVRVPDGGVGGSRAAWRASHRRTIDERWAHEQAEQDAHRDLVGTLSERELMLVGAALYWAEGTKAKPWRRDQTVKFVNSDPSMVRLFIAYLEVLGVARSTWRYQISIHESADVAVADAFWREVLGPDVVFQPVSLKRHRPTTVRHNTGESYHGCLVIRLLGGATVYRRIAGTWEGIALAEGSPSPVV